MTPAPPVPSLPYDPDSEVDGAQAAGSAGAAEASRPVHLRSSALVLVCAGGTAGAGVREALTLAFPTVDGVPWATFAINLSGAFLLGFLLDALARRGPDRGRGRMLRLLLGTGFLGGYTTYSALAVDTAALLSAGAAADALWYALGTVLLGGLATWSGILIASLTHRSTDGDSV